LDKKNQAANLPGNGCIMSKTKRNAGEAGKIYGERTGGDGSRPCGNSRAGIADSAR